MMTIVKNSKWAGNALLVLLFFIFLLVSIRRNSGDSLQGVIWSDVEGYYMYLPAVFINKSFHNVPERTMNFRRNEKGEIVMKYTCGVAFFYLPFFLAADIYAHKFNYNTSGFSTPYYYGMIICGVFWAFVGLFFLKKLLLRYFDEFVTWSSLLCIMLGTNFFHYSTKEIGMSHIYSFTLVALTLLLTDSYYKAPDKKRIILLSLLLGWLTLIRPTNCSIIIVILLFNVNTTAAFKDRIIFFKNRIKDILLAVPFVFIPLIPQMLYWKEMTGRYITYSYDGEGFIYWRHPKILAVLFDTQNGLLLYAPILLLSFLGVFVARKDPRTNFIGFSIVFVVITYIFSSWWQWCFGAAFGHRCYIEYLPVFAFPLAVGVEKIAAIKNYFLKVPVILTIILFLYYGTAMSILYDTTQFWGGPLWRWNFVTWADMTKRIF